MKIGYLHFYIKKKEIFDLTMRSTHFIYRYMVLDVIFAGDAKKAIKEHCAHS